MSESRNTAIAREIFKRVDKYYQGGPVAAPRDEIIIRDFAAALDAKDMEVTYAKEMWSKWQAEAGATLEELARLRETSAALVGALEDAHAAINLQQSMITSGEYHSTTSLQMVAEAREALARARGER